MKYTKNYLQRLILNKFIIIYPRWPPQKKRNQIFGIFVQDRLSLNTNFITHYTPRPLFEFIMNHRRYIIDFRMIRKMAFLLSLSIIIIILFLRMPYFLFAHLRREPECILCISRIFKRVYVCVYGVRACVGVLCTYYCAASSASAYCWRKKRKKKKRMNVQNKKKKKRGVSLCPCICIARWTIVALVFNTIW